MDLSMYQTCTHRTAVYPGCGSGDLLAVLYASLGLAGEAGEVANKVKKLLRDEDTPEKRKEIAAELGDVLWYLARVTEELGEDLGEIGQENLQKLEARQARGTIRGSGDRR